MAKVHEALTALYGAVTEEVNALRTKDEDLMSNDAFRTLASNVSAFLYDAGFEVDTENNSDRKFVTFYEKVPAKHKHKAVDTVPGSFNTIWTVDPHGLFREMRSSGTSTSKVHDAVNCKPAQVKQTTMRVGRFIKKYLAPVMIGVVLSDNSVERIVNNYLQKITSDVNAFSVLYGEDLREFYRRGYVSSCMSGDYACDYLNLYVDNPEVVGLLTTRQKCGSARALLWTIEGKKYLDRVYGITDVVRQAIVDYARSKGWGLRDSIPCCELYMKIRNGANSYWPYMDTIMYVRDITEDGCYMCTDGPGVIAQSTEGHLYDVYTCANCSATVDESDIFSFNGDVYCTECYDEIVGECDRCHSMVLLDEMTNVSGASWCESCRCNNAVTCECCNSIFDEDDDMTQTEDGLVCKTCLNEAYNDCSNCGAWVRDASLVETASDDLICSNCQATAFERCSECGKLYPEDQLSYGICTECVTETVGSGTDDIQGTSTEA